MGLLLIAFGFVLLVFQSNSKLVLELIIKWWPAILIVLGVETLVYVFTSREEEPKIKFDVFSMFLISIIITLSVGAFAFTTFLQNGFFAKDGIGCFQIETQKNVEVERVNPKY